MVTAVLLIVGLVQGNSSGVLPPSRIVGVEYPALALQARIQATIRFEVTTNETGDVMTVTPLSQNLLNRDRDRLFVGAVADSLKGWKFQTTATGERKAIITYIFKFDGEASGKRIQSFVFEYPGTVTVSTQIPN